jgi:mono/diheme cytochrome c family protein
MEAAMKRARPAGGRYLPALAAMIFLMMPPDAAAQDAAKVKRGEEVYNAQKCQVCHSVAGKGGKQSALDGVGSKLSAADLRKWIVDPVTMAASVKSTKTPPMPKKWATLPAADVDALVAYMQSLK